jgi:ATP-dependent Clp protease ATP-binding subunit ClpA
MLDRFSHASRGVVFRAKHEAGSRECGRVGSEHILLALTHEPEYLAARILSASGISFEQVRAVVDRSACADQQPVRGINFTDEANRIVEMANEAAGESKGREVGTAHLLVALLRSEGTALKVLRELGVDPEALRDEVRAHIAAGYADYDWYSQEARDVIFLAGGLALSLGASSVGTEHLLLALLRSELGAAAQVLESLGISTDRTLVAVEAQSVDCAGAPADPMPLSLHARRALGLSRAEASSLGSSVNPEHLLLGLAREGEGLGARILIEFAGGPDGLRNAVLLELSRRTGYDGWGYAEYFTPRAARVVIFAQEEARVLEHDHIGSEHLLLGLLREQQCSSEARLDTLNVAVERAREQVVRNAGPSNEPVASLLPLARSAREVLRVASMDMRWLEQDSIGPEHILLALICDKDTLGARVIDELEIDTDGLRAQALRALDVAWASELSPAEEELSRREQQLREAERRCRDAGTEEERQELEQLLPLWRGGVDEARGALLPEACREGLEMLVDFSTQEWLKGQPPPDDPDRHDCYRRHCMANIRIQLLTALFRPSLGPEANPITGHPQDTPFTLVGPTRADADERTQLESLLNLAEPGRPAPSG